MNQTNYAVIKKETIDVVEKRIKQFTERGELHFPVNYSPDNALKQAWLIIQETTDKDKRPALEVCSRSSVANALLNMVVQGLSPAKKQCYFIVYGKSLSCQRSYFGTMAVLRRVRPDITDIVAETIHEGDKVMITIENGRKHVDQHKQEFGATDKPLVGAYCVILGADDRPIRTEVMTLDQLKAAWKQSKMNPITDAGDIKAGSTHEKFTTEMARKTVISRACKALLNSSDDSDLVIQAARESDEAMVDAELQGAIEDHANGEVIDIVDGEPVQSDNDFATQLAKMADIDETLLAKALKLTGVDPTGEIGQEEFDKVSKKFNELFDVEMGHREQPKSGTTKEF